MKRTLEQFIRDDIGFGMEDEKTCEALEKQVETLLDQLFPLQMKRKRLTKTMNRATGLASWFDLSTFDKELQNDVVAYAVRFGHVSSWLRFTPVHETFKKPHYYWAIVEGIPSEKVVHSRWWKRYDNTGDSGDDDNDDNHEIVFRWQEIEPKPPTIYYDTRKEGPEYEKLLTEIDARKKALEHQLAKIPKLNERYQLEFRKLLQKELGSNNIEEKSNGNGNRNVNIEKRVYDFCMDCVCVCYDEVVEEYFRNYDHNNYQQQY